MNRLLVNLYMPNSINRILIKCNSIYSQVLYKQSLHNLGLPKQRLFSQVFCSLGLPNQCTLYLDKFKFL